MVLRQGCLLSPILFNLFINVILNNCDKYGVSIGNKKCCGGLFADDIVLIESSERKMKALLRHVFVGLIKMKCLLVSINVLQWLLNP